jgi:glycine/D-amino acid oxidase-like deaminating enzyme
MATVTVVGGGIAGLVAAIECAQHGADVVLLEATGKLGGRGRSIHHRGFTTNQGPHALYADSEAWHWLQERQLLPPTWTPNMNRWRVRLDGSPERGAEALLTAIRELRGPAPFDVDFRSWAQRHLDASACEAAIGYLTLPLYDSDPGRYSAASVYEVFRRTTKQGTVRYITGGWSVLVDLLVSRARELGVDVRTGSRVTALPDGPVIIATAATAAAKLLEDPSIVPQRREVALLDLGIPAAERPAAVLDLNAGVYAARYSDGDPSLAPARHDLIQCCAGRTPEEDLSTAITRIEAVLDAAFADWRKDVVFRRATSVAAPGAIDAPGSRLDDRPNIGLRDAVFLAGDYVAAPGVLSEISFNSGCEAARRAIAAADDRVRPTA